MKYMQLLAFVLVIAIGVPLWAGTTVNYTYDALGRLTKASYSGGTMTGSVTYSYDDVGNIPNLTVNAASTAGDVNFDGIVDLVDAVLFLQILSGGNTSEMNLQATVAASGRVGMGDAIIILRELAGI